MFILKPPFLVLILEKDKMHFEAEKTWIDAVPNRSEFHCPLQRVAHALPLAHIACEMHELADFEGKNLKQTAVWIPSVFFRRHEHYLRELM